MSKVVQKSQLKKGVGSEKQRFGIQSYEVISLD